MGAPHLEAGHRDAVGIDGDRRVDAGDFRIDHQIDEAVLKDRRREGQRDAELLEVDGDGGLAAGGRRGLGHRDRKLAAGQEAGGLARHRGQVRLGEGLDETLVLERVHHDADVAVWPETVIEGQLADRRPELVRKGVAGIECKLRLAVRVRRIHLAAADVDAQFLGRRAFHLDETHRQHHLLYALHRQHVHDLAGVVALGEGHDLLHRGGAGDRAGQDQGLVRGVNGDILLVRQDIVQSGLETFDVGRHDHVHRCKQMLVRPVERNRGRAEALADDVDRVGGEGHHVGDLGICHHDVRVRRRQLEHLGLAGCDLQLVSAAASRRGVLALSRPVLCIGGSGERLGRRRRR